MDYKSKKILIVEDETDIRGVLADSLREQFTVSEGGDGEEGLAIALKEHPDLILLDVLMPKMSGTQMLQKLREDASWGLNVPVIMLTNFSATDEDIIRKVAELKPLYYFVKSEWEIDDLLLKVKEVFDNMATA